MLIVCFGGIEQGKEDREGKLGRRSFGRALDLEIWKKTRKHQFFKAISLLRTRISPIYMIKISLLVRVDIGKTTIAHI